MLRKYFNAALTFLLSIEVLNIAFEYKARRADPRALLNLGNGQCLWADAVMPKYEDDAYDSRTMIASYPGSGIRVGYEHMEGLTGEKVVDDWGYIARPSWPPMIKTLYPHYEGIWSYGANISKVVLFVRNPRWAIPGFHTSMAEIHYAKDKCKVNEYIQDLFRKPRPGLDTWYKWRDHLFDKEIELWVWFIDYWMEGGTKYWTPQDVKRAAEPPLEFIPPASRGKDVHCEDPTGFDCKAVSVISYERLTDHATGLQETGKLAAALTDSGVNLIGSEFHQCAYDLIENANNDRPEEEFLRPGSRDQLGRNRTEYKFTYEQMETLLESVSETKIKYSTGDWQQNEAAQDLVTILDSYLLDIEEEFNGMQPSAEIRSVNDPYYAEISDWYNSVSSFTDQAPEEVYTRVKKIGEGSSEPFATDLSEFCGYNPHPF